jgi:hypothetical protein
MVVCAVDWARAGMTKRARSRALIFRMLAIVQHGLTIRIVRLIALCDAT